jgi:hypothetical protein
MIKKSVFISFALLILLLPAIALAQGAAQNMIWSQGECTQLGENGQKLCNVLWTVQQLLYAAGIGLAVIMIIVGGIIYATAQDDEEKIKKAKKTIIKGIIGVVIVFAFAFILGFVRDFVTQSLMSS